MQELSKNTIEMIEALVKSIELRDSYTKGHSKRVATYSVMLSEYINLDKNQIYDIYNAALLHDIGKIGIPDAILLKPEKLNDVENNIIKQHSSLSAELVSSIDSLKHLAKIVKHHHEKYNGSGYPDGLKEKEIPLASRIITVADIYDALTSTRVYRSNLNDEQAKKF